MGRKKKGLKNMKKMSCMLLMIFAIMLGCMSCSDGTNVKNGAAGLDPSVAPEYTAVWPENDMTAHIPEPQSGTVHYVRDYSEDGRYEIVLKDISRDESAAYVGELKAQGYTELAAEGNAASVGTMLKKDNVFLSVAYSGTGLSLLITVDKAA